MGKMSDPSANLGVSTNGDDTGFDGMWKIIVALGLSPPLKD